MIKRFLTLAMGLCCGLAAIAQINTDQVLNVGRNALYFEDYVLSIQYFNQVIGAKPYLAQPYFYRALAKYNLDDFRGAETDVSMAIERNPFITDAYELRGVLRENLGNTKAAIEDFDKALTMLPENRSLLFNKAMALVELKRYGEADTTFTRLLTRFPHFENGYLGRAQLLLARKDTVGAMLDINRALEINRNLTGGYIMRAEIAINSDKEGRYSSALKDMDEAIRLNPKHPGYFINRAFVRYKLDDYFGAMSDYDYAIQLDPDNFVAHYNRAMLCTEVRDYDKALRDFNEVIRLRPDEYRTLYNRAIVYRERHEYKRALDDVNKVIEAFPDLAAAYFLRFDIKKSMGNRTGQADLDKSLALAKQRIKIKGKKGASDTSDLFGTPTVSDEVDHADSDEDTESQETVSSRFSSLLTVNDNLKVENEFNNKSIRGKVQDRNMNVEIEPIMTLTYFISPTDLKPSSDYVKELDEINRTRALRFLLQAANREPSLTDEEEIKKHFESIEYYNSYISTHAPRAIDFFGRGMDYVTVHNYEAASADFNRAVELTPGFTLAWFMAAVTDYRLLQRANAEDSKSESVPVELHRHNIQKIVELLDKVIALSPNMAAAHYNKGVILLEAGDYTSAISSFNKAIQLKPDFGEAYYNRGYTYLMLGNKSAGMADLSKSGELGIVPSFNLLKRMRR